MSWEREKDIKQKCSIRMAGDLATKQLKGTSHLETDVMATKKVILRDKVMSWVQTDSSSAEYVQERDSQHQGTYIHKSFNDLLN